MSDQYILVRVREEHPDGHPTDMGRIRAALHAVMSRHRLNAGDLVLSAVPNYVLAVAAGSKPQAKADFRAVDELYTRHMDNAKTASQKNARPTYVAKRLAESAEEYRQVAEVWWRLVAEAPTSAEKEKKGARAAKYEAVAKRYQELADAEMESD